MLKVILRCLETCRCGTVRFQTLQPAWQEKLQQFVGNVLFRLSVVWGFFGVPSWCDQGQFYIIFFQGPVTCMTHCPSLVIKSRLLVLNLMNKLFKVVELDLSVSVVMLKKIWARYMGACWSTRHYHFLWVQTLLRKCVLLSACEHVLRVDVMLLGKLKFSWKPCGDQDVSVPCNKHLKPLAVGHSYRLVSRFECLNSNSRIVQDKYSAPFWTLWYHRLTGSDKRGKLWVIVSNLVIYPSRYILPCLIISSCVCTCCIKVRG